jgi:acetyltransferase-like isoleucine patch superfamily enzyme
MYRPIKEWLRARISRECTLYWFLSNLKKRPIYALFAFIYAAWLTYRAVGRPFPLVFIFSANLIRVVVQRHKHASFKVLGRIIIEPFQGGCEPVFISLAEYSEMIVGGDFILGGGVKITLGRGAILSIGGRREFSGSGITCNTRVMVEQEVVIGCDTIISWGCFITDSDWHYIKGSTRISPVLIGNRIWVGHDVSILKGVTIKDGCIVGSKSLLINASYDESQLLIGAPARAVRQNVFWER